jgi:FMN phosphatase YigB (HAD superfamily)
MDRETPTISSGEIEERKLHSVYANLPEESKQAIGGFEFRRVGDVGFIIQRANQPVAQGKDWVLFDYDDTITETSHAKVPRQEQFTSYLQELDPRINPETCRSIMELTDNFSRWQEHEGASTQYHTYTHIDVLDWSIQQLRTQLDNGTSPEAAIADLQATLSRIQRGEAQEGDPFHFNEEKTKLINNGIRTRNEQLEQIFGSTIADPRVYDEIVATMRQLGAHQGEDPMNLGILTYGEPNYQFRKIVRLLEKHPDLPVSQIFLTEIPKGEFIKKIIELESDESGQLFGKDPHTVVLVDDDPKQLDSMVRITDDLKDKTGARVRTVRSVRSNTKRGNATGDPKITHPSVNFDKPRTEREELDTILQRLRTHD